MKVVIAGASGMVGSALVPALRQAGYDVARLVRGRSAQAADEIAWNPATGDIDRTRLEGASAVINLAGENLASGRWTTERRNRILRSRVDATRTLVEAISQLAVKPQVLVNASAVGYYGDHGDEPLKETSGHGRGFLSEVCLAWEAGAEGARQFGVRTVLLRFGMILAGHGGALAKMLPVFRLGLGGRLGSGRQWTSWVSLEDVVAVIEHCLRDGRYAGPANVVAPGNVTNREFTEALSRTLRRPAVLPAPAWGLRLVFGRQMANEAILASIRAVPERLRQLGYVFRHPTLDAALAAVLRRSAEKTAGDR